MEFDLIIRHGEVIDAAQSLRERRDVGIVGGKIAAVEPSLPVEGAGRVIDAGGKFVTAGWIDMHVHAYLGTDLGIDIDAIGARSGTTTAVDTGSSGAHNFDGFRRFVIEKSVTRILPFLNISTIGTMSILLAGELENIRYCNVDEAVRCVEANRDLIQGIKVRSSGNVVGSNGIVPVELARAAAERVGLPMMIHIGPTPPSLHEILSRMRPGDILTHCYTGHTQRIYDSEGEIFADALAARERGILMDIGHGMGSLSFDSARTLLGHGFKPDTISTDLHAYSYPEPVHDLPTTVSKFLTLGLSLEDAIAAVTATPAKILKLDHHLGSLRVGATADVAVFEMLTGDFTFVDSYGQRLQSARKLVNSHTIKEGRLLPVV